MRGAHLERALIQDVRVRFVPITGSHLSERTLVPDQFRHRTGDLTDVIGLADNGRIVSS